jgi:hypothetical protein
MVFARNAASKGVLFGERWRRGRLLVFARSKDDYSAGFERPIGAVTYFSCDDRNRHWRYSRRRAMVRAHGASHLTHDGANAAQPEGAEAEQVFGPPEPFSPQADRMTQPISSGARWTGADFTCSESSREQSETLTCADSPRASCGADRAHRVAATAPHRDAGNAAPPFDGRGEVDVPDRVEATRGDFCARADTVVEGFLCNDPVAVSNACRKPTNDFDEFVCDEPRMQRLQWAILRETWAFVKTIAMAMVRGKP